jgi:hypothetical protein
MLELDSVGMLTPPLKTPGKFFVTELGGGGSSSRKLTICRCRSVLNNAYPCGNSEWRITIIAYRILETR